MIGVLIRVPVRVPTEALVARAAPPETGLLGLRRLLAAHPAQPPQQIAVGGVRDAGLVGCVGRVAGSYTLTDVRRTNFRVFLPREYSPKKY